jgi:hypothetical protein
MTEPPSSSAKSSANTGEHLGLDADRFRFATDDQLAREVRTVESELRQHPVRASDLDRLADQLAAVVRILEPSEPT